MTGIVDKLEAKSQSQLNPKRERGIWITLQMFILPFLQQNPLPPLITRHFKPASRKSEISNEPGDVDRGGERSEGSSVHSVDNVVTRLRPIGRKCLTHIVTLLYVWHLHPKLMLSLSMSRASSSGIQIKCSDDKSSSLNHSIKNDALSIQFNNKFILFYYMEWNSLIEILTGN